jgi:23S rRNA (cytosine1962-C5)-methyltransferase
MTLAELVDRALAARTELLERLRAEGTDSFRVFHGAVEGREGLAIDRYGPLVLAQTFRGPLADPERAALEAQLDSRFPTPPRSRSSTAARTRRDAVESTEHACREADARFLVRARHKGLDPWLFLDLRAGRRRLRELAPGRSVLNLFAYTCAAGVAAAVAGAREVWNVDFSRSALAVGRRNAAANAVPEERVRFVEEDCLPVLRQLAGLTVRGRGSRRPYLRLEPRTFDLVFLDPPAWAKGPFGAVDVERDYPALFKPALLATAPGGAVIATNHAAAVDLADWLAVLRRSAEKAGRSLESIETIAPDPDFPTRDGRPPLKIAVCRARD